MNYTLFKASDRVGYIALFFILFLILFSGCNDELFKTDSIDSIHGEGLTILIPNVISESDFTSTRNNEKVNPVSHEADIKDLWLIAVEKDRLNESPQVIYLSSKKNNSTSTSQYKAYTVSESELPSGNYYFYVLANVERFLPETNKTTLSGSTPALIFSNKSEVDELTLNFGDFSGLNDNPFMPLSDGSMCLPMACIPEEIRYGASQSGPYGYVPYEAGRGEVVYADLTFLVAKIRYTILFNSDENDSDSFSSSFGETLPEFLLSEDTTPPTVSKVRVGEDLVYITEKEDEFNYEEGFIQRNGSFIDIWKIPLRKSKYPTQPDYPYQNNGTGSSVIYDNLEDYSASSWTTDKKRAWQGVVYLPENRQSINARDFDASDYESDNNPLTYLSFPVKIGEESRAYKTTLQPLEAGSSNVVKGIERGKFYDVCFKLKNNTAQNLHSTLSVSDWNLRQLKYSLYGAYELVVEKTAISVSNAIPTIFWYRSDINPDEIEFRVPRISYTGSEGEKVEEALYNVSVYKNSKGDYILNENGDYQIEVKINPVIPYTVLKDVGNGNGYNFEDFKYFEIVAGVLSKKIDVEDFDFRQWLSVNPKDIILDVRDYLASGDTGDKIEILIQSNINGLISLEGSGLDLINGSENLWISADSNTEIDKGTSTLKIKNGEGRLFLNLKNIFPEDSFWSRSHTKQLTLTSVLDGESFSETITIRVKPFTTNYTIHFRPSKDNWTNPHIYVYQCLELPADLKPGDNNYAFRGKTVGYGEDNCNAALQYAFTNNISFKGWFGYGGTVDPNQDNSVYSNGFVHLGEKNSPSGDLRFNPMSGNTNIYDFTTDLNNAHEIDRDSWLCPICREYSAGEDYNRNIDGYGKHLVPGVSMAKEEGENSGWYKYTLSGVATPGKTLVMFYDDHDWISEQEGGIGNLRRYPNVKDGKDPVGVALFDFSDNEGWLVYNGDINDNSQSFYADKPEINESEDSDNYFKNGDIVRIIWYQKYGSAYFDYINIRYADGPSNDNWFQPSGFGYSDKYNDNKGNMNYYDFKINVDSCNSIIVKMNQYGNRAAGGGKYMEFEIRYEDVKDNYNPEIPGYEFPQPYWPETAI